ncbi:MAG: hypothetical protein ACOH2J_05045 [Allorhizobium sp.]
MSEKPNNDRSSAIAAAIIVLVVGAALYLMPIAVLWIGAFSPVLAAIVGTVVVLSFFLIFWFRARYQRRHPRG